MNVITFPVFNRFHFFPLSKLFKSEGERVPAMRPQGVLLAVSIIVFVCMCVLCATVGP